VKNTLHGIKDIPDIIKPSMFYTVSMGRWRLADKLKLEKMDITLKSGLLEFAPSPKLLFDYKGGKITDAEYEVLYEAEMKVSYTKNRECWDNLLYRSAPVALMCYCGDKFCHRHLLIKILARFYKARNVPFPYGGELTKNSINQPN